jgi:MFS family permease
MLMHTRVLSACQPWFNWALSVCFVVLVFGFQTGYAITNGDIAHSLSLDMADIGLVGFAYTWCFAISQLISGALLDRVGARRLLPLACALLALGATLVACANSLTALLIAQLPLGLGASFAFIGAGFVGGVWFAPERYGVMFAWVQFVASIAAFLSQITLTQSLVTWPWPTVIYSLAAVAVGLTVLMLLLRDPPGWNSNHGWPHEPRLFARQMVRDLIGVARVPGMLSNLCIGAASFGSMLALGVVWAPRLVEAYGIAQQPARIAAACCWLGMAFGAPLFARCAGANPKKPLLIGVLLQLAVLVLLLQGGRINVVPLALLLFIFGVAAGASMLCFSIACMLVGPDKAGIASALVNGSQFVMGGLMMMMPARWVESGGVLAALTGLPLLLLLVIPVFIWLPAQPHRS